MYNDTPANGENFNPSEEDIKNVVLSYTIVRALCAPITGEKLSSDDVSMIMHHAASLCPDNAAKAAVRAMALELLGEDKTK